MTTHYNAEAKTVQPVVRTACLPFGYNTANRNAWTALRATNDRKEVTCARCLKALAAGERDGGQ